MRLVFLKTPNTDPMRETDHLWNFVAQYHNDELLEGDVGNERLRSLGPGELVVIHIDPKTLDEGKPTDKTPVVRRPVVSAPTKPKLTEVK